MANVIFSAPSVKTGTCKIEDIADNVSFSIATPRSKGAVYRRVVDLSGELAMLEEETGRILPPTKSPIILEDVDVVVKRAKPKIYG